MNRIFNYELHVADRQMIHMPKGAEIIGLVDKYGIPYLLAIVDEDAELEVRMFRSITTGEKFNKDVMDYIGTLRLGGKDSNGAWYTMHVFELIEKSKGGDPIDPRFKEDRQQLRDELNVEL